MTAPAPARSSPWVPTLIVLVIVLAAGTRQITLSVREHTERARATAQRSVEAQARQIGSELHRLAERAVRPSAGAAGRSSISGAFTVDADGRARTPGRADAAIVQSILQEWPQVAAQSPRPELIGPAREGGRWIVAVRSRAEPGAWRVAYESLDDILARARFGRLVEAGYDFELSQKGPAGGRARVLMASRNAPLSNATATGVAPPPDVLPSRNGLWALAVRPSAGWYPLGRLAGNVALLGLVAWVLALFVFDSRRDSWRMRGALEHSRQRLEEANQRLVSEIEERVGLQKSLEHARYHDAFTGLPNRRYFMNQLDRALREVRVRRGERFAVVLLDVDRLKLITDTLGHPAGDEVMVQSARRLERAMTGLECVLARWDGHRFAVLLHNVYSRDTALSIASALQVALREPFELRGQQLRVTAGVGVRHVESGLERAEDIVREADVALSVASGREGDRILAYDPAMSGDVGSMVSLEADLHVALARDELRVIYQPVVALDDHRIVGAEALVRWQHPVEGLLPPERFLGIAEDTGLIVPLTRWVMRRACALAAEWRRRLTADVDFYVSVNLSAAAMRDAELGSFISDSLSATALPPKSLKLEVTERDLIGHPGAARDALARLHALGIGLMLDDFGTGYSSLSLLQLFPFDYVKIDRPFGGSPGEEDETQRGVTDAIVRMASSLGMDAIAERVESATAVPALQGMGCRFAQGYLFSEPLSAEQLLRRLRAGSEGDEALGLMDEDDDSPTLVMPIMAAVSDPDSEWPQPVETVVIAPAEEPVVPRPSRNPASEGPAEPPRRWSSGPATMPIAEARDGTRTRRG